MSDNIKVVVKVRPLIARELQEKLKHQWRVNNNTLFQLDSNGRDNGQAFTFDKVYSENAKTSDVYDDVAKPIVEAAVAGFNGTIFAYGQTSSGKTYTMTGTEDSPGVIPLAVHNLFEKIKNDPGRDFVVSVSYIEIYNETLTDLLDHKKAIKIQDTYHGVKVDATEKVTASPEEVIQAMTVGNANRQTGSTNMNESSSRSHSIFQICIESREHIDGEEQAGCVNVSQLNLVDLAGSERAGQTGATGLRFKEGTLINKSLTSLALVIKQLSEGPNKYTNYRDSKLTRILQNSLGGNAKTCIICAITPAALEETNSTLQFATRAKAIKNTPEVNAVATDATRIQGLTKELSKLQSQLESKKNLEVILESKKNVEQDLHNRIAKLQRVILNGFSQRPSVELMGGARRKLLPPRRITISTLHSIEEHVPQVPKFCTPSLKYNPSLIQNPADFEPIQNQSKPKNLPEEPPRGVTSPSNERKVNFSSEIIELDSDDDDCPGAPTCSPYHKCFGATKTPPCVLRKNAKQAEKNFQDLQELTDREKMYTPSVVELIEKIEQSTTETAHLQDEIEYLKTISKEKDLEIEKLRCKIDSTEVDMKSLTTASLALESQRKALDIKLTDWEVSYETLKNRYKLREQELLFLLDKQKIKQAEDIGKMPSKPKDEEIFNLMDMSKDLSLVNSDNESSVAHSDDDESSEHTNILIDDMQTQLETKNHIISELESKINTQKQHIELMEKSSSDLQEKIDSFKVKIGYFENENALLKSTVNELNCTIKSQREHLQMVQNDTNSYNSLIQELQIKLTNKENLLNMHISHDVLENMLANEDKTIANNENLKNIIHSFKLALTNSKKEIDLLKSRIQNNNESGDKDSMMTKQLEMLNEEISKLKKQANENMVTINTLLREKGDLAQIEQELIIKISEVEQRNSEHDILSKEQTLQIETLKNDNERLETTLAEKRETEKVLINLNETLFQQVHEAAIKITELDEDIKNKNTEIINLNNQNIEFQDCLAKAGRAVSKLQDDFLILTGDVREIPVLLDSFVLLYNTLYDNLNILENITFENVANKELALKNNIKLKNKITDLVIQHKSQISDITKATHNLIESVRKLTNEINQLNDKNNEQEIDIEKLKHELNTKNTDLNNLEMQLKAMKVDNINMRDDNLEKDPVISSLKGDEIVLFEKNKILEAETNSFMNVIETKEDKNQDLNNREALDKQKLNELQQKCDELTEAKLKLQHNEEASDRLVENIIKKLSNLIDNIKEKNSSVICRLINENRTAREHILPTLDAVVDHVARQSSIEVENEKLKTEMKQICNNNQSLNCDLKQSTKLLQHLQEELQMKAAELDCMQHKAKEWKEQFSDLDLTMKEQMLFLQMENEKLKTRSLELNNDTKIQLDLLEAGKDLESSLKSTCPKSGAECEHNEENMSPSSLLTICCNTIIETINKKQNYNTVDASSSSFVGNLNTVNTCLDCHQLVLELRTTQQENTRLMENLEELKVANKELLNEHNEMRDEIRLLVEPTLELQKKIVNHRTNLSILTATTYAENKSLKSQVKGLQHHHNRFHNVCQRDIPEFKKQLNVLMAILKEESSYCDGLSHKRYSLPNFLENNSTSSQIRNESTFDGDLLMLDTNATFATADNTLVGNNQTCLDFTQTMFNETGCQIVDHNVTEPNMLSIQMDIENKSAKLAILEEENSKLKKQINNYLVKESQSNPINSKLIDNVVDTKSPNKEMEHLIDQLSATTKQKEEIEKKYNDLVLEIPSTEALVHKLKSVEEDLKNKEKEFNRITNILNAQRKDMKALQEENDLLSTQVMEHITEVDELNKEVEKLKQRNLASLEPASELDNKAKVLEQHHSDEIAHSKQSNNEKKHFQLNRSLRDSDTASRHSKICTLQSEIHAGREDCKVLTEDVATIKHHLDHSNMSMDLDESVNFELATDSLLCSPQSKKCNMPDIQEECPQNLYTAEKNDCFNYYLDKMGLEKESLTSNIRIIEIMKLLHNSLVTKHGNEVENLVNQLKDYQETQTNLQTQINDMNVNSSKIKEDLILKDKSLNFITNIVTELRDNLSLIQQGDKPLTFEDHTKISRALTEKFLAILDKNFNLFSVNIFEHITIHTNKLYEEYTSVSEILTQTKCHLSEIEKECNSLKAQNERIHEINNAVTLDIIMKEKENNNVITETYQKLLELKMISPDTIPLNEPVNIHILIHLLQHFINEYQTEKAKVELSLEMNETKADIEEKEKKLNELQIIIEKLHHVNNKNSKELSEKDEKIQKLEALEDELNSALKIKEENNDQNLNESKLVIQNLSEEINQLKELLYTKEQTILSLSDKDAQAKELLNTVKNLQDDITRLKALNEMISQESESYASELEKSCVTIKQNNIDIDKMTSDILVLRESMKEATGHMEKLKVEVQTLAKDNIEIKQELQAKSRDCSRLEFNIKTHEKTAEIQSRMILRLQKLKEEDDKEKLTNLNEVNDKYEALQNECEVLRTTVKTCCEEIEHLKISKQSLENRLAEEEDGGRRSRTSLDAIADSSKRRRQSLHDSKRLFEELEEHKSLGALFESRQKVDDRFMEVDDDTSGRSTPFGNAKGRDSLLSKTDHSDKEEELSSRPSSVLAKESRRRRQSSHDLHRSVAVHAPSPADISNYAIDERQQFRADTSRNRQCSDNEITQLRSQLASCVQELEDLKEKYRELDEECEICSEYLRERDAQCSRLKKEKTALEKLVTQLRSRPETHHPLSLKSKPSVAHVSVNTDEDWTNLHDVVVDRMSYDAEVEKNKKLTRTIEELRFTKLDLKNTLAKMQKALERNSAKDNSRELEQMKQQLKASNEELKELRVRCKNLDDECETCSKYLKEREEQCRRLKEAKMSLETKLQELQEQSHALEHTKTVRKKRQTIHDSNRPETSAADQTDAATETTSDFSCSQMERDDSTTAVNEFDVHYLKKVIERLTQQNAHLENQLRTVHAAHPMFVATGSAIVQNQQITDVMKENQKLKKINAKLVNICKKRGKSANRENEDPCCEPA